MHKHIKPIQDWYSHPRDPDLAAMLYTGGGGLICCVKKNTPLPPVRNIYSLPGVSDYAGPRRLSVGRAGTFRSWTGSPPLFRADRKNSLWERESGIPACISNKLTRSGDQPKEERDWERLRWASVHKSKLTHVKAMAYMELPRKTEGSFHSTIIHFL